MFYVRAKVFARCTVDLSSMHIHSIHLFGFTRCSRLIWSYHANRCNKYQCWLAICECGGISWCLNGHFIDHIDILYYIDIYIYKYIQFSMDPVLFCSFHRTYYSICATAYTAELMQPWYEIGFRASHQNQLHNSLRICESVCVCVSMCLYRCLQIVRERPSSR